MKKILLILFISTIVNTNAYCEVDCTKVKKLSKDYLRYLSNYIRKNSVPRACYRSRNRTKNKGRSGKIGSSFNKIDARRSFIS